MKRRSFLKGLTALLGIAIPGGIVTEKFDPILKKEPVEEILDDDLYEWHPYSLPDSFNS